MSNVRVMVRTDDNKVITHIESINNYTLDYEISLMASDIESKYPGCEYWMEDLDVFCEDYGVELEELDEADILDLLDRT